MTLEALSDLNTWIAQHKALVVTVGVPLLTAFIAGLVSVATNRANLFAQRKQRMLQIEVQLCQFRQAWIDSLRDDFAQASQLASKFRDTEEFTETKHELVGVISSIRMRLNPEDPEDDAVVKAMAKALGATSEEWDEDTEALSMVGQRILKREWERLKTDLHKIESRPE